MATLQFIVRKLFYGIPLILGVSLISFVLMVYFGPDKTYDLLGKNPTPQEIAEVRAQLGYDQPFFMRYWEFLKEVMSLDFGYSDSTNEKVSTIFGRTIPVTLALMLPGFILGNLLGILLALIAAFHRGGWVDKAIMLSSVVGMSISFLIVIIGFQIIFSSSYGLNLFPVTGWEIDSFFSYIMYVTVPTLCSVFVALGYNTRFYRAVIVEEMGRDHVRTARAFGCPPMRLLLKNVLRNCMIPISTRIIFTIPFIVVGGSLLLESYFSIPGVGLVTFEAITTGDLPIVKAVVTMTAILYVFALTLTDVLYQIIDPRISLR